MAFLKKKDSPKEEDQGTTNFLSRTFDPDKTINKFQSEEVLSNIPEVQLYAPDLIQEKRLENVSEKLTIEDEFNQAVSDGLLPDQPKLKEALKSGKLSLKQAKDYWFEKRFKDKGVGVNLEERDSLIKNLVVEEFLPADKNVIEYLKLKPESINQTVQAYQQFKKSYGAFVSPEFVQDKIDALKSEGIDTADFEKKVDEEYNTYQYLLEEAASGATIGIYSGDQKPRSKGIQAAGTVVNILASIPTFMAAEWALFGKGAMAAGRGLFKAAEAAESSAMKGFLQTTGKIVQAAPKLSMSLGEVAKYNSEMSKDAYRLYRTATNMGKSMEAEKAFQAAKHFEKIAKGATTKKFMFEQTVLGAGTGFTKGMAKVALDDGDLQDVVIETMTDAIFFPLAAGALQGAGGIIGKTGETILNKVSPGSKAMREFAKQEGKGFASSIFGRRRIKKAFEAEKDYLSKAAQEMIGVNSKNIDPKLFEALKTGNIETLTTDQVMAVNALNKIAAFKKSIGESASSKITKSEIVSQPKLMKQIIDDTRESIKEGFKKEGTQFNLLYQSNGNIKSLVDSGQTFEALDSAVAGMKTMVKDNKSLQDFLTGPLQVDAEILSHIHAKRVAGLKKHDADSEKVYESVFKYLTDDLPEVEKEKLLTGFGKTGKKKVSKKDIENQFTKKLTHKEVNDIIFEQVGNHLNVLSGKNIKVDDLGTLVNSDQTLKAMIHYNDYLNKSFIESFKKDPFNLKENFGTIDPNLRQGVRDGVALKQAENELSFLMIGGKQLSKQADDAMKAGDEELAKYYKDLLQSNFSSQSSQMKKIRELNIRLNSYNNPETPNGKQQIQELVSDMFIPQRHLVGAKKSKGGQFANVDDAKQAMQISGQAIKESTEQSQSYLDRFIPTSQFEKNPLYIKQGSELAETVQSMLITGKGKTDVSKEFAFALEKGPLANFENFSRKLQKEFGSNSVFERWLVKPYKEAQSNINVQKKQYYKRLKDIGIKADTELSGMIQKMGEGRMTKTSPEFLALSADDQAKVLNGIQVSREIYDELIGGLNEINKFNGLPAINKRDDYFHHFQDFNSFYYDTMDSLANGSLGKFEGGIGGGWMRTKSSADPKKTFLSVELPRSGGEFKDDAIGGLLKYIEPSLERIHYSNIIREVDVAKKLAPDNLSSLLQGFKENYLLNKEFPFLDPQTSPFTKKATKWAQQRYAEGSLLWNLNTVALQLTSLPLNFGISGSSGFKAMLQMGTKNGDEIFSKSLNKKVRDIYEGTLKAGSELKLKKRVIDKIAGGKVGKAYDAYKEFGSYGLELFDTIAVKHAYLTGYNTGISNGLNKQQAHTLADKWVDIVQADMSKIGRSDLQNTVLGRAATQFLSFTSNLFQSLMNDLPNYALTDGSTKAVSSLMRIYAGATIANEVAVDMGMPAPYNMDIFIPFNSANRYGLPSIFSVVGRGLDAVMLGGSYIGAVDMDKREQAQKEKDVLDTLQTLFVPGGRQLSRSGPAVKKLVEGKYKDKSIFLQEFIFGAGGRKFIKKQKHRIRKEKGPRGFLKKQIKEVVR